MASFDEAIPPGQVGKMTVQLATHRFRGPVRRGVSVKTNDPHNPAFSLIVKANVVTSAKLLPGPEIELPHPQTWERTGRILLRKSVAEKEKINVTDLKSRVAWLEATARPVLTREPAAGGAPEALPGDWVIELRVRDDAPAVRNRQTITFATGLSRLPEMKVDVQLDYSGGIQVNPTRLVLTQEKKERKLQGEVAVRVRPHLSGQPLEAIVEPEGAFSVALERLGDQGWQAKVTWRQTSDAEDDRHAKLTLAIGEESIALPLHVRLNKVEGEGAADDAAQELRPRPTAAER